MVTIHAPKGIRFWLRQALSPRPPERFIRVVRADGTEAVYADYDGDMVRQVSTPSGSIIILPDTEVFLPLVDTNSAYVTRPYLDAVYLRRRFTLVYVFWAALLYLAYVVTVTFYFPMCPDNSVCVLRDALYIITPDGTVTREAWAPGLPAYISTAVTIFLFMYFSMFVLRQLMAPMRYLELHETVSGNYVVAPYPDSSLTASSILRIYAGIDVGYVRRALHDILAQLHNARILAESFQLRYADLAGKFSLAEKAAQISVLSLHEDLRQLNARRIILYVLLVGIGIVIGFLLGSNIDIEITSPQ